MRVPGKAHRGLGVPLALGQAKGAWPEGAAHRGRLVGGQFSFPKGHGGRWLFPPWEEVRGDLLSFLYIRLCGVSGRHIRIKKSRELDPKSATAI